MSRLIPSEGGNSNKQNKPEWFDIDALDKAASKELQARSKIKVTVPNVNKQVIVSRVCNSCHKVFSESSLDKQKKVAARAGQAYIACPNCDGALKVYKTATIAEKPNIQSVVKLSPNRIPGRVPNTWLDRAHYGRMVNELEKFCKTLNLTSIQIRFQRGIRAKHNAVNNSPGSAEFSIDYIDKSATHSRIYTTVSLSPSGEFTAPKTFYLASGKTFPFTIEAIDQLASGKVFDPLEVEIPQARLNYRDKDITRFPHTWSKTVNKMKKTAARPEVIDAVNRGLTFDEVVVDVPGITQEEYNAAAGEVINKPQTQVPIVPTATDGMGTPGFVNGTPGPDTDPISQTPQTRGALQPGQEVTYNGSMWVVDEITPDGVVLRDSTTGKPQFVYSERYGEILPTGTYSIGTLNTDEVRKLAVDELNKEAARDEDTYIPVVEADPDYSVAEQSQRSEKPFDVPYSEMDQGVLPEEDRGYTTMFRANRLNLKKHAGKGAKDQVLWNKAEKAVDRSKYGEDTYWKVVSSVYQKMGGEFNASTASVKTAYISEEDGKHVVKSESGKTLGTHDTKAEAEDQLQAIEISKHKEGQVQKGGKEKAFDHQHPYEPKTKELTKPNKKEMDEFEKKHPKKRAEVIPNDDFTPEELRDVPQKIVNDGAAAIEKWMKEYEKSKEEEKSKENKKRSNIQKTAEPTGYKEQDGSKDKGWPVEYDRVKKMLESLIRQSRTPIPEVDLHALKDNKYSRDEIVKFLDKMQPKGDSAFFPPTTAAVLGLQKDSCTLLAALEDAINNEIDFNEEGGTQESARPFKIAQEEEKPSGLVDIHGRPIRTEEEEPEEEHLPTTLREKKIAPPGFSQTTVVPQPATEEQQQIWGAAQEFDSKIKAIDQMVNKAMMDMQAQVKELRERGQYTTLVAQRQKELDKLGTALEIVQDTVVSFKDNVLMILQEAEPALTQTQEYRILQKLMERYPKLIAAFDAAKERAQSLLLEQKGVSRELTKYPKKTEKVQPRTVTAAFLDEVQELTNILGQINNLMADLTI